MKVTEYIPINRYQQWHDILCQTGGRYLYNPFFGKDDVLVKYEPGDYEKQCEMYYLITTPINEKVSTGWRKWFRRIKRRLPDNYRRASRV